MQKYTECAWNLGSFPALWSVCVPRPLYCSVESAFAASAAQSCWLQILPYMVIHCSLPDSLPRPFPPCPAIGCFMQCQYTCEFWDRLKYEERPGWENWVEVKRCFCHRLTHCNWVPCLNIYCNVIISVTPTVLKKYAVLKLWAPDFYFSNITAKLLHF